VPVRSASACFLAVTEPRSLSSPVRYRVHQDPLDLLQHLDEVASASLLDCVDDRSGFRVK
jgi:hypothetical protein